MNSRRYVFTLNNYDESTLEHLRSFLTSDKVRFALFGYETAATGTPHLQGYVSLVKPMRRGAISKQIPKAYLDVAKGTEAQNIEYCSKEKNIEEFGVKSRAGFRSDLQDSIDTLKSRGIQGVVEDHPECYVKYHRGLEQLNFRLMNAPYVHDDVRGYWVWGPPGTGKSHSVRELAPNAYVKPQNKWWDGYNQEEDVILDDLDTNTLGHYLKIWCDKYACTGETKGGTIHLRHKRFFITSNYTPHQLWPDDPIMCAAIKRRCIMTHKALRDTQIETKIRL